MISCINVVYAKWRLKASKSNSALLVLQRIQWRVNENARIMIYLGVGNGDWDVKKAGRKSVI